MSVEVVVSPDGVVAVFFLCMVFLCAVVVDFFAVWCMAFLCAGVVAVASAAGVEAAVVASAAGVVAVVVVEAAGAVAVAVSAVWAWPVPANEIRAAAATAAIADLRREIMWVFSYVVSCLNGKPGHRCPDFRF